MEELKLPFKVEYAKSGRAACKSCKDSISKDTLRLAVMVQSPFFDGMQPNWHHFSCFFKKFRPKATADISHFESIRWEDQEIIRKEIEKIFNPSMEDDCKKNKSTKPKKRGNNNSEILGLADYTIQYSKSKRAKCKVCDEIIEKDVIRISKKDYESEIAMKYGPVEKWHHVDCFAEIREQLEFFESGENLPGFNSLTLEDQKIIKSKIPKIDRPSGSDLSGPSSPKKMKKNENNALIKKFKKQNDEMFKYHDFLKLLKIPELKLLLEFNKQEVPEGSSRMIERLSDAMAFGALRKCEKCKGQLVFSSGQGYVCKGYVSEWLKCDVVAKNPPKTPFQAPNELIEKYSFLKKYKGKVLERLINENQTVNNRDKTNNAVKTLLLSSMKFFIYKIDEKSSEDLKSKIIKLGGSVIKNYRDDVLAVISTSAELKKLKNSKTLKSAQKAGIPVLSKTFFDELTHIVSKENLINKINEEKISTWESNVRQKIKENNLVEKKSMYSLKESKSICTIKDGLVVDPDSELGKIAHVYKKKNDVYNSVLSLVDVQSGKNSYYKMQILESDKKEKYWLFRSWGRIGTTIGGCKCEEYETLEDCIELFKKIFEEQTGNKWEKRKNFKKVPGKKIMLDVDYKEIKKSKLKSMSVLESKMLNKSVQDLMTLIFDKEAMERAMLDLEIDLEKMPLGKLSRKQITSAFTVLNDVRNLITGDVNNQLVIEKTNIFYSLIPHNFGTETPRLLNNQEIIKEKFEMLSSLVDIEIAYRMLENTSNSENSIDKLYKELKTEIIELDSDSKEYEIIELYMKNTHGKTHMNYSLEIENVFKIEREGEADRYKKFSTLSNRKLLWHGSRTTNFVGILSQGLRIAPPEAPSTGYMFGKGIYFADMVSKSANYCNATGSNSTGLLLLCEVALGNMLNLTEAKYIEKLPPGKNSVKGVGQSHPDPTKVEFSPTGAQVPIGKSVDANIKESDLLYNEYIVYNVNQVKIQYLVRVKFNFTKTT